MIDKGLVMPDFSPRGRPPVYPYQNMEIGDSFAFTKEKYASVSSSSSTFGKKNGKKFRLRMLNGEYRCWRVA